MIDKADMPSLYKAADAFVLPTRGEGWGLPFMEAMAMGLPTIATNFSGHLDFMSEENAFLISIELTLVPARDTKTYGSDVRWAQPSVTSLVEALVRVVREPEESSRRGEQAARDVRALYDERRVSRLVADRLGWLKTSNER